MEYGHNSPVVDTFYNMLNLTVKILFWLMLVQRLSFNILKESIIFNILYLIGYIPWSYTSWKRGRPYLYSSTVILRCFIVRIWFKVNLNNALHIFLNIDYPHNYKLALSCSFVPIPRSRRTFYRWLRSISTDVIQRMQ